MHQESHAFVELSDRIGGSGPERTIFPDNLILLSLLEILDLALPIILGIIPQHLPRLLDTNQPLSRVFSIRRPLDIWINLVDELLGRNRETGIGVGDVENVLADQRFLHSQAERLSAIARVNITEPAIKK